MDEAGHLDEMEAVLLPFSDERPIGEDLRLDVSPSSIYFRLRDARAEARAEERQADNDPTIGGGVPAQWTEIRKLAMEALREHGKDLEVACWLTEALTRYDGLAGLADGVDILVGLISRFWDGGLYPTPEDDAPEDRLIAITGMSGADRDGSLLQPLRKIVLFARADGDPVTVWQFERARDIVGLAASRPKQAEQSGGPSFLDLEADARGIGQERLRAVGRDARRAEASWRALEEIVETVAQGDAVPSTSRVRAMIETIRRLVERYVPEELVPEAEVAPDAAAPATDGVDATAATAAPRAAATLPETREALLDELMRIASLFRQSEPNSPLSFTIEEAVRRARLSWPELLRELIPDEAARTGLLALTGMRPTPEPPLQK